MNKRRRFNLRAHIACLGMVGYGKDDPIADPVDPTEPTGGGGGTPPKKKDKPEPKKIELTAEDLEAKLAAARDEERTKLADERQKEKDDAARAEAEKRGEFETIAADEKNKRVAAERRAQLAEVNVQLRDHLAANHTEYLANAPDIMLHVASKLDADAKTADIRKAIADESTAFVARTPRGRVTPPPAPLPNRQNANPTTTKNGEGRVLFTGASAHF